MNDMEKNETEGHMEFLILSLKFFCKNEIISN